MGIELKADGVTGASQGAMSCQQGQETRSKVERIAAFAVAARPERLTPEIRQLFKRNVLDSLACAIAALPGRPFVWRALIAVQRAQSAPTVTENVGPG
jgi:2-methylcitrate dehydratase PrpD